MAEGPASAGLAVQTASNLLYRSAGPLTPTQRLALWISGLTGLPRHLAALLLGVLAAAALPPFDLTPILLVSFMGLVWLADGNTDRRSAFAIGWSFGFGFFAAGFYWIGAALLVDAAQFWWLMPFAVLGLPAFFALFSGAALLATHELCRRGDLGGTARIFVLAGCWAASEWLRGHLLTGFPWNLIGYSWAGAFPGALTVLQSTAFIGIYGLSLVTVLAAALPARLGDLSGRRRWPAILAILLVALPAAGGFLRLADDQRGTVPGVLLRLVQPSIPQTLKSSPAAEADNFRRLLALSAEPAKARPTVLIWPEAAAPPFLGRAPALREAIARLLPPGGLALVGSVRTDPPPQQGQHYWNSIEAIDPSGNIIADYDKFHLVPFGEYVPLRDILPINKITPGTVDLSAGPGPRTLVLPGVPPVGPLVCYEVIFPGAVVDPNHRPAWLLNVTNDAWYGFTSGPFQHLAIARVRAVEEGLPLVRDGNNGISAVVNAYGRVTARLDLDSVGVLDSPLPDALPPTLYSRVQDTPFAVLLLLLFAAAAPISRLEKRRYPGARMK